MTETTQQAPADVMRRAAELMRERAEGCEARRWFWRAPDVYGYPQQVSSEGNVALIAETYIDPSHRPYEAEHIASWHPLVAAAVADWLDREAALIDAQVFPQSDPVMERYPLAVARAYLGEPL
jgi:hypothetical protein